MSDDGSQKPKTQKIKKIHGSGSHPTKKEKATMAIKNILNITLEQCIEYYETLGIAFCIRDGQLKGFYKNV